MSGSMTTTLRILYNLVRLNVIGSTTVSMFIFMRVHNGLYVTNGDLVDCVGATVRTLHRHIRLLEHLDLLEVERKAGMPNRYYCIETDLLEKGWQLLLDISSPYPPLEDLGPHISLLCLELRRIYKSRNLEDVATPFSDDDDWKRVKEIMRKHFTLHEIERGNPTSTKVFTKIYALLEDSDIDLDSYAAWYKKMKYRTKRFSWGMFLYDSMIAEYIDGAATMEEQLRTSSDIRKRKHAANADKAKDFYESIPSRRKQ